MGLLSWISLLMVITTSDVESIVVYANHEVLEQHLSVHHSDLFVLLQCLDGIEGPSGNENINIDLVHRQRCLLLMYDLGHRSARAMEEDPQFLLCLQYDLGQ